MIFVGILKYAFNTAPARVYINAIKHAQTGTRQVTTKVMAAPTWKWYHELGYSEVTDVY